MRRLHAAIGASVVPVLLVAGLVPGASAAAAPGRSGEADPARVASVLGDSLHLTGRAEAPAPVGRASAEEPETRSLEAATSEAPGATGCFGPGTVGLADRVELFWDVDDLGGTRARTVEVLRSQFPGDVPDVVATLPALAGGWTDRGDRTGALYRLRVTMTDGTIATSDCQASDARRRGDIVSATYDEAAGLVQGNSENGSARHTVPVAGTAIHPTYSPDGRVLVYAWMPAGGTQFDLYQRNANGTGSPARLTFTDAVDEVEPAFSPDGRRLALTRASATSIALATFDMATRQTSAVTSSDALAEPDWSADGRSLFATDLLDPSAPVARLTWPAGAYTPVPGTDGGFAPAVSADGKRLAFLRVDEEGTVDGPVVRDRVMTVPVTGGDPQTVLDSVEDTFSSPTWDPLTGRLWWGVESTYSATLWSASSSGAAPVFSNVSLDAWLAGFDLRTVSLPTHSDYTGDRSSDVIGRDGAGRLFLYPRNPDGVTWSARRSVGSGWNGMTAIDAAGDLTGDGRADLLARDATGILWIYPGNGAVSSASSWGPRIRAGHGWNVMTDIEGVGDFSGDGRADIVARDGAGTLWLYPGNGMGGFSSRRAVGSGWNTMSLITGVGDVDLDGGPDLVARDRDGRLWLYRGSGSGGFIPRLQVGTGWQGMTSLSGSDAFGADSAWTDMTSLLARDAQGVLWEYPFIDGRLRDRYQVGSGWNVMTAITA